MRRRFTPGLLLGASSAGIAYACGASVWLTVTVGAVAGSIVWFSKYLAA
ncbi:hypothetical protein [Streptomyces turgidiscabies]